MTAWTHIDYVGPSRSGLTSVWVVWATAGEARLGEVRWFGQWRQYVFALMNGTVWNPDCMDEVSEFVRSVTVAHRDKHRADV